MFTAEVFREQLRELYMWSWGDDDDSQRRRRRMTAALEIAVEVATITEKVNRALHRKEMRSNE